MAKHVIRIGPDGQIQFIDKPELAELKQEGKATKRRASHVEPCRWGYRQVFRLLRMLFGDQGWVARFTRRWPIYWRVNLTPSGGPILPVRYLDRELAIKDEVEWLNANKLGSPSPAAKGPEN